MIKHIVAWKINEGADKKAVKEMMKQSLEALIDVIPQIVELEVKTNLEETSTHDIVLLSVFKSMEDLKIYANHSEHLKVANGEIKSWVSNRICVDFEI